MGAARFTDAVPSLIGRTPVVHRQYPVITARIISSEHTKLLDAMFTQFESSLLYSRLLGVVFLKESLLIARIRNKITVIRHGDP